MKIVVDDKIPYIQPALHELADEVVAKAGSEIGPADVRDATILLVRTRTRCNRQLLEGSSVRLVVTATIGYDHLDTAWLDAAGIAWSNCPGCNATSVAQYVRNSLLVLQHERGLQLHGATVGIVGVGHVGTAVARALAAIGCRLLLNDPLLEADGQAAPYGHAWSALSRLQAEANIITFHTPLTTAGPHPTLHMADAAFFRALQRQPVIINAARGGVVDEAALLQAMDDGRVSDAVIDTWEGEPSVNPVLLHRAVIATPHIAGYSADGKANATRMTLERVCRFLGKSMAFTVEAPALTPARPWSSDPVERALQLYDPRTDSENLKKEPEKFEWWRGHYPLRRE